MRKIILTLPFLLFPLVSSADYRDDFYGHHMNMGGFGFWGGGIFFTLLFWALIIIAVVYLVKYIVRSGQEGKQEGDNAMEILRQRYAKGEIDKDEFEQKKKELMKK